jgi:hypothetical protein
MKKILFSLFIVSTVAANSQRTDLVTVNTVKPKAGQKMAFEAAYKKHIAAYHKAGEKINVYEIMSGEYQGYYHLVDGGRSFSDFDKDRPDATAHNLDLDKTFFPLLEKTMSGTYRFMDTLSLRPDTTSGSFVVTVNHLKQGLVLADYRRELARAIKINSAATTGFVSTLSTNYFEQLWDGSDQVTVIIRNLKNGFKDLEPPVTSAPPASPSFREVYEKAYGGTAWDDRVKLLDGAVIKAEQYIMRWRKDLSSQ